MLMINNEVEEVVDFSEYEPSDIHSLHNLFCELIQTYGRNNITQIISLISKS